MSLKLNTNTGMLVYTFKNGLRYEGEWDEGRFVPESYVADPSVKTPTLIITEKHSGFDYNKSGCFLLFAEPGVMRYEQAASLWCDYNFDITKADEKDFVKSDIKIYHDKAHPSSITLHQLN